MKPATLLVGGASGIVLFTILLPWILSLLLGGDLLVGGAVGAAWLCALRVAGELVVSTIPGRGWV